jgi:hypothetical protein
MIKRFLTAEFAESAEKSKCAYSKDFLDVLGELGGVNCYAVSNFSNV